MKVAVIVPFRDKGDPDRRANYETTVDVLAEYGPQIGVDTLVVVSDGREGPFNRSAAYNRGVVQVDADVYIFHEADMIVPPDQLGTAAILAHQSPGLVIPFTEYRALTPADTQSVRGGASPAGFQPDFVMAEGTSVGAVGVCSADTMEMVGRWDECFRGWGHDDIAMFRAFAVCAGRPRWVEGPAYHLWHPPGMQTPVQAEQDATNQNYVRWTEYKNTADPELIRAMTMQRP